MKKLVLVLVLVLLGMSVYAGNFEQDIASMDGHSWQRFNIQAKTILLMGVLYGVYFNTLAECGYDKYQIGKLLPENFHGVIRYLDKFYADKDNRDVLIYDALKRLVESKI